MKFLLRLAFLILFPLLLLGLTYSWVVLRSPQPDSAALVRTLDHRMTWAGETLEVSLHLNGDKVLAEPAPGSGGQSWVVMLVIDHSGSMGSGLASPLQDAKQSAGYFARVVSSPLQPVGAVGFDQGADIYHPIDSNGEACAQAILTMPPGGGTDIAVAIAAAHAELARALRETSNPGARGLMILLSDGGSERAPAVAAADRAKGEGIRIITIGLGSQIDEELLRQVASSEADFHYTIDSAALGDVYMNIAGEMSPVIGHAGTLTEKYHYDGFTLVNPIAGFQTYSDPARGLLQVALPVVFAQRVRFPYTLRAEKVGLYRPALDPAELSFLPDPSQPERSESLSSALTPPVMVVSPLLLFLLYLPALGYLVWRGAMLRVKPAAVVEPPPKPASYPMPPPLELPPPVKVGVREPQPTLFVGLGRTGRELMGQLLSGLDRDRFLEKHPQPPVTFVQIDGLPEPPSGTPHPRFVTDRVQLPGLVEERAAAGSLPAHLGWLPRKEVQQAANAELSLSEGSKGNRWVSRWALFTAAKDADRLLLQGLERVSAWCEANQSGRIVLVASIESGAGAILLDTAYLLHRVLSEHTRVRARFPIYVVALADVRAGHPSAGANQAAFLEELDRFQIAGQIPTQMTYLPGASGRDAFLDGESRERFFDRVFLLQAPAEADLRQVAGLLQTMTEKSFSRHLQRHLDRMRAMEQDYEREFAEGTVHSLRFFQVRFPTEEIVRRLARRFVMEVLGRERLVGVRSESGRLLPVVGPGGLLGEAAVLWEELDRYALGAPDSAGASLYRLFCQLATADDPVLAGLTRTVQEDDLERLEVEFRRFGLTWFERYLNGSPESTEDDRARWRRHRISYLHHLVSELEGFGTEAMEKMSEPEATSLSGRLVARLTSFHGEVRGLTGAWLARLIDGELVAGKAGGDGVPGLYRRANVEYEEIARRLEQEKQLPWCLVLDDEAEGEQWTEEAIYQRHLGTYLETEQGFLPRWRWRFEGESKGPVRLALELTGARLGKFYPADSEALYAALLELANRRLAPLEAATLYDRLELAEGRPKPNLLVQWFVRRLKESGIEFDRQRPGADRAQRSVLVLAPEGPEASEEIAGEMKRLLDCEVELSPHYEPQTLGVLLIDSVVPIRGLRLRTRVEPGRPLPFVFPAEQTAEQIRREIEHRGVAVPCPPFHPLIRVLLVAPVALRDWLAVLAEDCLVQEFDFSHHDEVTKLDVDGHAEVVAEPGQEPKQVWALLAIAYEKRGTAGFRTLLERWRGRAAEEKAEMLTAAAGRLRDQAASASRGERELSAQLALLLELESRLALERKGERRA